MFRHTHSRSQCDESKEKSCYLDQTFLLPRGDGDLRKKTSVMHNSTQDPLVLQLLEEAWPPHKKDPQHPPSKRRQSRSLTYNSILKGKTGLNTLTSLSPPWYTGDTPMKNGAFSSPPPSLAEL
ncbi:hypothetical protein ACFX2I_019748 [Malus domestica]